MKIFDEDGQICLFDPDIYAGKMCRVSSPRGSPTARTSGVYWRKLSELKYQAYQSLDLTPGAGNLLEESYWELLSPWRGDALTLNTGVSPREERESSLSQILQDDPPTKYYLTRKACLGILRRAAERGKELPEKLKRALEIQAGIVRPDDPLTVAKKPLTFTTQPDELSLEGFDGYNGDLTGDVAATLGVNCGMSTGRNGLLQPMAFAANQRDEVRDLHDKAGSLGAQPGMKQQTFIAGIVAKGNGDCFLSPERHTTLSAGGGQAGQGYPCIMAAGFSAGQGSKAGGIGYQEECAPTLKSVESGSNMIPSILCLNDQGGKVMECSVNVTGTLRAQEHGHQPILLESNQNHATIRTDGISTTLPSSMGMGGGYVPMICDEEDADALAYTGNILQGNFCESDITGAQMSNQNKCYNNLLMPKIFGQQSYANYAEGVSTLAATGGTLGGGGENLVVSEPEFPANPPHDEENQPELFENHGIDSRYTGPHKVAPTMSARYGTGGNNVPLVSQESDTFCIMGNAIDREPHNGGNGIGYQEDIAYTLTATDHHAVFSRQRVDIFKDGEIASTQSARQHKDATDLVMDVAGLDCRNAKENGDLCGTLQKGTSGSSLNSIHPLRSGQLIRRLTPLECERLQGFPDGWTDIPDASDSARYKALGNSVAIPCVEYIMRGIMYALKSG